MGTEGERYRPEQDQPPETESGAKFPGDLPEDTEETDASVGGQMRKLEKEGGERGTPAEEVPPEPRQGARE